MQHPKGFPSRLVRLRAEADLTQKELSRLSGVSVPQIARYETGTSKPRMAALVKLAKALKVDVSALANADDEPAVFEMVMIDENGATSPLALSQSTIDWLQADAEKHGVTLEATLHAMITFAKEVQEGSDVTYEQVLAESVEYLNNWPGQKDPKE